MTNTEMADRIYQASGNLWAVAAQLEKMGLMEQANAVRKAWVAVPTEIAKALS